MIIELLWTNGSYLFVIFVHIRLIASFTCLERNVFMMIHFTKVVGSESSKARWIGKLHARERCNEKFENPEMKSGAEEMPPLVAPLLL